MKHNAWRTTYEYPAWEKASIKINANVDYILESYWMRMGL